MMNRRNWFKSSAGLSLAPFIPYVLKGLETSPAIHEEMLRLHWNENPHGPSFKAKTAMVDYLSKINHYPDDYIAELKTDLANLYGCANENILITAGSTEILSLLGEDIGLEKGHLLMSEFSFPTLAMFTERSGGDFRMIPLGKDYLIDLEGLLREIREDTSFVFICNPNNPTSSYHPKQKLIDFMSRVPERVKVCIDEAYIQFSRDGELGSMIDQVSKFKNLIVCRTFSKAFGLAGMRVGFAIGHPDYIRQIGERHPGLGWSNSLSAVVAARVAMHDTDHLNEIVRQNEKSRVIVYNAFDQWGVDYVDSNTNFIYAKSTAFHDDVVTKLKDDGIMITKWPNMIDHFRISLGKTEWMERFVTAIEKYRK